MKVLLDYSKDLHFKASVRKFIDFDIDEPISFHGTDLGPSAVEYLLIGIGGCLGTTFVYCLQNKNIELEDLKIEVDGKLSHSVPKMFLRLASVDVELKFTPKEANSELEINKCIKTFREYCIISNSIAEGLPINVKCTKR
jgi:uncharacterized OsmC-like protein